MLVVGACVGESVMLGNAVGCTDGVVGAAVVGALVVGATVVGTPVGAEVGAWHTLVTSYCGSAR